MALVPFTNVALVGGQWVYTWAGSAPVRVVLWGITLSTQTANTFSYPASSLYASLDFAPPIEVVVSGQAPSESNLAFLILQWFRVACNHYEIDAYNGSGWVFYSTLPDSPLVPVQTFTTALQPDETISQWRVFSVSNNKRQSDPITFSALVVRPPDDPRAATLACTGGILTVGQ